MGRTARSVFIDMNAAQRGQAQRMRCRHRADQHRCPRVQQHRTTTND